MENEREGTAIPVENASITAELQALLRELIETQDQDNTSLLADKTLQLLRKLPPPSSSSSLFTSSAITNQLHGSGVALWNKAVSLKSAAAVSLDLNAQLRLVASTVVLLCSPNDISEHVIKKHITMALKTGRAWLDCDNPEMAETSLELANQFWERLAKQYPEAIKTPDSLRLLFKIFCSQSEASIAMNEDEKAMNFIKKAQQLLVTLDKEVIYLSMLCYNFGLHMFQCGKYSNASVWLKESYDIGRSGPSVGAVKQARTLRLLANTYLEWDAQTHWQKALNAVGLANSEHSHPTGLLLKTSILLQFTPHVDDRVNTAMQDTLSHPDLTQDMGIAAVRLAAQNGNQELAINTLQTLKQKLKFSSDKHKLQQLHLELLLEGGQFQEAKHVIESYIQAHNSGDTLDPQVIQHFHLLLWEQASKQFECKQFSLALEWYNYSLALFPSHVTGNKNISKLQRNCCTCYIELQDYDKAMESIQHAITHDENSVHSHFLHFKLCVLLKKEEECKYHSNLEPSEPYLVVTSLALLSLQTMTRCSNGCEDIPGLLALAAQMAFENNSRALAISALENIVKTSSDSQQVLISLRCLIRLKLTLLKDDSPNKLSLLQSIIEYTKLAHQHVPQLSECENSEAIWFMKIAWNTALQTGDAFPEMARAFEICRKFSLLLPSDKNNIARQKTCHLMAAASSLQAGRTTQQAVEKVSHMESVLSHVNQCQDLFKESSHFEPTIPLLVLYKFEAQLALGIPDAGNILNDLTALPDIEPKTYEAVAALVIRIPPKEGGRLLAQNALKSAIELYTQSKQPNMDRLSRCTHSLIQLIMGSESGSDMVGKEQAMVIMNNTLQLIEKKGKFPDMEVVWHMVKAWNTGIHLYSMLRYKEAEQWCSLAMKFFPHLPPNLSQTYEPQMSSVYEEILSKVDNLLSITLQ